MRPEEPTVGVRAVDTAVDWMALPAGHQLQEYRIERVLGGGGFGITYLARDTLLDREVAIKEYLPSELASRAPDLSVAARPGEAGVAFRQGLERFLDESRVLATFRHPHIVRVNRYFAANATAYMVMDYARGQSLKQWVDTWGRPDHAQLLSIIRPLLEGLEVIHAAGFLHRDIKPANITMRPDEGPVLLDFGAARRWNSGHSLTTIVTPGFAPLEQYHSHGNQGPWSDIYSMAAVMYWLVSGNKPVEAAARVREDPLVPATRVGDARLYGMSLLRAIDWALDPDESRRPRSVGDFRRAFLAGGDAQAKSGHAAGSDDATTIRLEPPGAGSARANSERPAVVATVLCAEPVDLAGLPADSQTRVKEWFNGRLAQALAAIAPELRVSADSGAGAAVCLLGDPEDALRVAARLARPGGQEAPGALRLRVGIHLGPVRVAPDVHGRTHILGGGLDTARQVMGFAQPGQVLVDRSYFDIVACLAADAAHSFLFQGVVRDPQDRAHEVFLVDAGDTSRPLAVGAPTRSQAPARQLTAAALAALDAALARRIGPLARVLVSRCARTAADVDHLLTLLGSQIPDAEERDRFRREAAGLVGGAPGPGGADSRPSRARDATGSAESVPRSAAPSSANLSSGQALDGDTLARIEKHLARAVGPLAKVLVKRAAARSGSVGELCRLLAGEIEDDRDKAEFLRAVGRSH